MELYTVELLVARCLFLLRQVTPIQLHQCLPLETEGFINTTSFQYEPTYCPLPPQNKTDCLIVQCFTEHFRNCSSEQELFCEPGNQALHLKCRRQDETRPTKNVCGSGTASQDRPITAWIVLSVCVAGMLAGASWCFPV